MWDNILNINFFPSSLFTTLQFLSDGLSLLSFYIKQWQSRFWSMGNWISLQGFLLCEDFSGAKRKDFQQPWPMSRPSPGTPANRHQQCDQSYIPGSRAVLPGLNCRYLFDCHLVQLSPWDTKGTSMWENAKMHEIYFTARKLAAINVTRVFLWVRSVGD